MVRAVLVNDSPNRTCSSHKEPGLAEDCCDDGWGFSEMSFWAELSGMVSSCLRFLYSTLGPLLVEGPGPELGSFVVSSGFC